MIGVAGWGLGVVAGRWRGGGGAVGEGFVAGGTDGGEGEVEGANAGGEEGGEGWIRSG